MFQIFLKTAVRNLLKNKLQSAINIIGLAVGLATVLCIAVYLQSELSYDQFHTKGNEIYRIGMKAFRQGNLLGDGHVFTPPIGPAMKDELAGVKNYTRYRTPREAYLSTEEKSLKTEGLIFADSTFFPLFSFPILSGNAALALTAPYSLVLTESTAQRLFGQTDVLGKTVSMNNGDDYQITGIAADPPANSHIQFKALASFSSLYLNPSNYMDWNGGEQYITFVQLVKNTEVADVENQLPNFMWRHINEAYAPHNIRLEASLQALSDIHLGYNSYSASLRTNLYFIGGIVLLILVIACFNFINLATALAGRRAKEVGVRKVLGASKSSLSWQFLGETFMVAGIALLLSLFLAETALPFLPKIFGKPIAVTSLFQWTTLGWLLLLLLITGVGAGLYPSLYLASYEPTKTLKGMRAASGKMSFRSGLVVFQFVVSIILVVSTLVVSQQLNFTQTKTLGFDKENVLVIPLLGADAQPKIGALKQELKKSPQIIGAAACSETPGRGFTQNGYTPEGMEEPLLINVVDVDDDYLQLFGLEIISGRSHSMEKPIDRQAYLINEALAQQLGWEEPVGKKIRRNGEHEIVGVVENFHYASLHEPIKPLIVTCSPWQQKFDYLAVKLAPGNLSEAVQSVSKAWQTVFPGTPMDHRFLDENIDQIYQSERSLHQAFIWGTSLFIFIALMGVFGLTTFTVEQRIKEIGIRKVLGATTAGIVGLLSKDFLRLILIAFIFAMPFAWYIMNQWLQSFAYRINIEWSIFAMAGIGIITIAFLTVSFQSFKVALANPVESLRSE